MGRHTLRLIMVLGALVTLLGGTGIFAVFNDQAVGGENSATSGSRQSAADLMIATASVTSGNVSCGTFVENTTTPQIVAADLQPSSTNIAIGYACLRNVGAAPLTVLALADRVTDIDTGCTGDEAESGDLTCGSNGQGELSPALMADIAVVNCTGATTISSRSDTLSRLGSSPMAVGTSPVAAGAVVCLRLSITYPSTTSEATVQVAQSDTVTWNYLFEGTAS